MRLHIPLNLPAGRGPLATLDLIARGLLHINSDAARDLAQQLQALADDTLLADLHDSPQPCSLPDAFLAAAEALPRDEWLSRQLPNLRRIVERMKA
jgi:hypothetical protein